MIQLKHATAYQEDGKAMKTLFLLRHAKSEWSNKSVPDHDRALAPRGARAAAAMGQYLTHEGIEPHLAICSTAVRARQTWDVVSANWPLAPTVDYEKGLYLAGASGLLKRLKSFDADLGSIMIIGHNPDIEKLILGLARKGRGDALSRAADKVPTCAFAEIHLPVDNWEDIEPGQAVLERFTAPKDLV